MYVNTIQAINVLNVKLQRKQDELNDLHESLFDNTTLNIKEWRSNELAYHDSAVKTMSNCDNEIEAKIGLLSNTLQSLIGMFSAT